MNAHRKITDLFVAMQYRWTDACEIISSVREMPEAIPVPMRSEATEMISKLGSIEHDAMAILVVIRNAKAMLQDRARIEDNRAIDILANMERPHAS